MTPSGGIDVPKRPLVSLSSSTRIAWPAPLLVNIRSDFKDVSAKLSQVSSAMPSDTWTACKVYAVGAGFLSWVRYLSFVFCQLRLTVAAEGTLTCVVAFGLFFIISDFPEEAKWLTEEEKAFVKARLADDVGQSGRDKKMSLKDVLRPFKDCAFHSLEYTEAHSEISLIFPRQELPWCSDVLWTDCTSI